MCDLGENETVERFLLNCKKYNDIRQSFIENLRKVNTYLNHNILNSENQASLICNYVSKLLKERKL